MTMHGCAEPDMFVSPGTPLRAPCFIESQFPVVELSHECTKERRAGATQTLTGLGKWWGRKPLVLARAALLGVLLPSSDDPRRDRAVFLQLMQMDDAGLLRRRHLPLRLRDVHATADREERRRHFADDSTPERTRWRAGVTREERATLQRAAFLRLPYAERLKYCRRPEHVDVLAPEAWAEINAHVGTSATSLGALVRELGVRRFGHAPRVGDAFCGGGAIPFEAARLGCNVYAADLSPVAALQTWAAIHVLGGGRDVHRRVECAQQRVLAAAERQIATWGIELDEAGNRAEYCLYCTETTCPRCGWSVPVAPSWLISQSHRAVAILAARPDARCYDIEVRTGCDDATLATSKCGSIRRFTLVCPHCRAATKMSVLRNDAAGGLRRWGADERTPRDDDVLRERLYAIRWLDRDGQVRFRTPTAADHARERRVQVLLAERFAAWQRDGFLPRRPIEPGVETTRLGRERGWTHWQHLFAPRQLLLHGLLHAESARYAADPHVYAALLLGIGACANWNSRLCVWNPDRSKGPGSTEQTFLNLALNTLNNFGVRGLATVRDNFAIRLRAGEGPLTPSLSGRGPGEGVRTPSLPGRGPGEGSAPSHLPAFPPPRATLVRPADARGPCPAAHVWITDPPYADAVNYHELSEFFLAWLEGRLPVWEPAWPTDSRRARAVKSAGGGFRAAMIDCYRNLAARTAPDGVQVVLFTHHDPAVWADLALTLRAAGLRVTAAWCVRTECDTAGYKRGRYVQETVVLVLRRRDGAKSLGDDEAGRATGPVRGPIRGAAPSADAPAKRGHAAVASPHTAESDARPAIDARAAVEQEVARQLALRAAGGGGNRAAAAAGDRPRPSDGPPDGDLRLLAYAAALTVLTRDGDGEWEGRDSAGNDSLGQRVRSLIEYALSCTSHCSPRSNDRR